MRIPISLCGLAGLVLSACSQSAMYGAQYMPLGQVHTTLASDKEAKPMTGHVDASFAPVAGREQATAPNEGYTITFVSLDAGKMCIRTEGIGQYEEKDKDGNRSSQQRAEWFWSSQVLVFEARSTFDDLTEKSLWPANAKTSVTSVTVKESARVHTGQLFKNVSGFRLKYRVDMCGPAPKVDATTKYITISRLPTAISSGDVPGLFVWVVDRDGSAPAPAERPDAVAPTTKPNEATAETPPSVDTEGRDLFATLSKAGTFTIFTGALAKAGLTASLKGRERLTVFAPTDAAFAALGADKVDALMKDPSHLKEVLEGHIVQGSLQQNDFWRTTKAHPATVTTVGGKSLHVALVRGTLNVEGAHVTSKNINAENGWIHAIDGVLGL